MLQDFSDRYGVAQKQGDYAGANRWLTQGIRLAQKR
jgi:hypothetical protein